MAIQQATQSAWHQAASDTAATTAPRSAAKYDRELCAALRMVCEMGMVAALTNSGAAWIMAGTITESDRARSCSSTCLIRLLQLWCFLAISPTITSASTRPSNPNTRISASLRLGIHAEPVHPRRQRLLVRRAGAVHGTHARMRFPAMLVDLDLALQRSHLQLEADDAVQHLALELLAQVAPLLRVSGLMLADELLEQHVFLRGLLDQAGLDRAMHREVVPRRHTREVGIDLGRQVRMRPEERDDRLRPCLQVAPMRVGLGAMPPQRQLVALARLRHQRQVRDEWQAVGVVRDQARERMRAHQLQRDGRVLGVELRGHVHGGFSSWRTPIVPEPAYLGVISVSVHVWTRRRLQALFGDVKRFACMYTACRRPRCNWTCSDSSTAPA